jgi:hypothetical protein
MALNGADKAQLDKIIRAAHHGKLGMVETTCSFSGERVVCIAFINRASEHQYTAEPLARLFQGNPFDELDPTHEPDDSRQLCMLPTIGG